jgi:hypothetical protein
MLHARQVKKIMDEPRNHAQVNECEGTHRVSHAQSQGLVDVITSSHTLHRKQHQWLAQSTSEKD